MLLLLFDCFVVVAVCCVCCFFVSYVCVLCGLLSVCVLNAVCCSSGVLLL